MRKFLALAALCCAPLACAQGLKLSVFERLKDKAASVTNLNLSKDILGLGASFLGGDKGDKDAAKVKKLADGLQGILIHSLEFDKEGAYTPADVQSLIAELGSPGWNLVISADEKKAGGREISRIWMKPGSAGEVGGLRILSAEAKELSVIEITGKIRIEDLKDLGALGVPNVK
jgi:hypothetical protein